jgi:hypothetical protein
MFNNQNVIFYKRSPRNCIIFEKTFKGVKIKNSLIEINKEHISFEVFLEGEAYNGMGYTTNTMGFREGVYVS